MFHRKAPKPIPVGRNHHFYAKFNDGELRFAATFTGYRCRKDQKELENANGTVEMAMRTFNTADPYFWIYVNAEPYQVPSVGSELGTFPVCDLCPYQLHCLGGGQEGKLLGDPPKGTENDDDQAAPAGTS